MLIIGPLYTTPGNVLSVEGSYMTDQTSEVLQRRGPMYPRLTPEMAETVRDKFFANISKGNGCWLWTGRPGAGGYGNMRVDGHNCMAHRVSYALHKGEIPAGLLVCHTCDNPPCVNPDHLFLGTIRDNNLDRARKGRSINGNKDKTHCIRGHALEGENLHIKPSGERRCLACDLIRHLRTRERANASKKRWWNRRGRDLRREADRRKRMEATCTK